VEAMASGRPVIAYAAGGVMETVLEGKTGLLFDEQTPESLIKAIQKFEKQQLHFSPAAIREHSKQFNSENFKCKFNEFLKSI
jgi:glycosyltransferase involved in cell wall biosynthesis